MIEITEEYIEISKKYKKVFGYGVPLNMIPPVGTTEELIDKLKKCIDAKEDNLLKLYNVDECKDGKLY